MKILILIVVITVSLFIGYKIGQRSLSLKLPKNISEVTDEIQLQINAIENRLINNLLTVEEKQSLIDQKNKLTELLQNFK